MYRGAYDEQDEFYDNEFAHEGSALRTATRDNPRNLPCPNCGGENLLTPKDKALGYQCDRCANIAEFGAFGGYGAGEY